MILKSKEIDIQYINLYSLSESKIGIPMFQRFYDWKEKQIQQLIEDIDSLMDKNGDLYLLDFIYYEDKKKIMLADGQQRIVTLNLLIKAFNDYLDANDLKISRIKYFDIKYDIDDNDIKYQKMMSGNMIAPFKKVYLELLKTIETKWRHKEEILSDIIMNKIFIYNKRCNNADEAYLIFQQINTGGKPLTKDEIIKTALDQYSKHYRIPINTSKVKEIRQAIISYYKYVEDDYTANFDNMLIMSFMNKYITGSKELFYSFSTYIDKIKANENSPIDYVIKYINRPLIYDVLNILSIKGINATKNKDYQDKLLLPLCLVSIILTLKGSSPPNYKYMINDIIKMIKKDKSLDEISVEMIKHINKKSNEFKIDYDSFCESLDKSNCNVNIKKALLIMDIIYRNQSTVLLVDTINLEHILPQKPKPIWYRNSWPTDEVELKKLINSIGNMILLSESINKKIQNNYITDKVEEYKKIMEKDDSLRTPINTVDFEKFETQKDVYINQRKNDIAKIIMNKFPLGNVLITNKQ